MKYLSLISSSVPWSSTLVLSLLIVQASAFTLHHRSSEYSRIIAYTTHTLPRSTSTSTIDQERRQNNISTRTPTQIYSTRNQKSSSTSNNGVTSTLISQLAVIALKVRLANHSGVSCDVNASSKNLFLKSSVGPVRVRGRSWESPLGLTCRAIDANVDVCRLDMNSVLQRRKLILVTPAEGKAMVALNPEDFGSFLTHPLFEAQSPSISTSISTSASTLLSSDDSSQVSQTRFEFSGKDVDISHEDGMVIFYGKCIGRKWRCELMRGLNGSSNRANIHVSHVPSESLGDGDSSNANANAINIDINSIETELKSVLSEFFSTLVFELDGTFLSFQDMQVHKSKDNGDNNVLLALGITVKKFPSPGVAF